MDLVHHLVAVAGAVVDARLHDHRGLAARDRRVLVLVLVRQVAPGDELAVAAAEVLQADVHAHAPIEAEVGVGVLRPLVEPGREVVVGADLLVALHGAAEPERLDPVAPEVLQDRPGPGHVGQGRRAHHAARHHVGGMRPLPAEQGVDLHRPARDRHPGLIGTAREGRVALHRLLEELAGRVVLVGEVDHEEAVVVARQGLQRFDDLAQIARQDRVARHRRAPGGVQRPGRTGQVRGAADAAGARRDDQAGLRILVAQNDLEAAEQLRVGPGVGDDAVLNVDAHVEVALDPADRRDVQRLNG